MKFDQEPTIVIGEMVIGDLEPTIMVSKMCSMVRPMVAAVAVYLMMIMIMIMMMLLMNVRMMMMMIVLGGMVLVSLRKPGKGPLRDFPELAPPPVAIAIQ